MRIGILTRGPNLYSTRRLVDAAVQRNHEVKLIHPLHCYMNVTSGNPTIHYHGQELPKLDAIIPRIGASITFYGTALVRQFEMMRVYCANRSVAITRARDKLRCLQLLSRNGIGLPITGFSHSPGDIKDLIKMVGGAPLIIKLLEGTQGIGVVLADNNKTAESMIEAFLGLKAYIMVQEYIREVNGADIRCLVVGGRVVAAMQRQAQSGEFRSNIHRGGTVKIVNLTAEEEHAAILATKIMDLHVAGVDLLRSNRGPLIMEVNASPGLEGIEKATKIDVASSIIDLVEKNVSHTTQIESLTD